jgi:hypothetical protein
MEWCSRAPVDDVTHAGGVAVIDGSLPSNYFTVARLGSSSGLRCLTSPLIWM